MFLTIPQTQPYFPTQVSLLVMEDQSNPPHLSQERQTIVTELEKIWQTLPPSAKNTDIFSKDDDLRYEPMPIEYSHTIEVTRNFVGEIPPQAYVWDNED
jgi:hypothetical protein